ncbi:NADPH-dependent FMN reductase [Pseudokordiimonas caeni]|uniref:NADPH-dependent FMN reductase n=1 Tax=Pseudokordiimonas caeni TaxID=2997908 RepID=UPI0028124546|nr:NAD(P)H-dependent oxidoreductase [Pseudokordiimonas caeni]
MKPITILAFSGSLRRGSWNRLALEAMAALAPSHVRFTFADIGSLPHYDPALDGETPPESVARLREAIAAANGLIFATPEYNYSTSGVLKNAIDWASRPAYQSVLKGKPAAILSATPALTGGVRAQQHLKTILSATLTPIVPFPEVAIGLAPEKFREGVLVDTKTREFLEGLLRALLASISHVTARI